MHHQNSVFHGLTKYVPWGAFDRLVEEHGADHRVRRLTTRSQLIALLYGQLGGATGLREIVTGLESHADRLYHLGAAAPSRSTLSDANANRCHRVFSDLFAVMIGQAQRGLRKAMGDAVRLVDATSLKLTGLDKWAQFTANVHGAKLHVLYDPTADRPLYFEVTAARVNDITVARAMPIEAGATYVFDLGYYDFAWWANLDAHGCRIVTRLKKNTVLATVARRPPQPGSPILSDRIGQLPGRLARSRRNPFAGQVREICIRTETGKLLRILTNDLDAPAEEIAALYKLRWQIELFFRWIKQTLKLRHFIGTSENAVRIQIAVALIAFLILRLAQPALAAVKSPLAFARLVRANLMHRRAIDALLKPIKPPNQNQLQLSLNIKPI